MLGSELVFKIWYNIQALNPHRTPLDFNQNTTSPSRQLSQWRPQTPIASRRESVSSNLVSLQITIATIPLIPCMFPLPPPKLSLNLWEAGLRACWRSGRRCLFRRFLTHRKISRITWLRRLIVLWNRKPEPTVTFIVGPDGQEPFLIHKFVATKSSTFFDRAFNGNFDKGNTQSMRLEDVEIPIFGMLLHWMYFHEIEDKNEEDVMGLAKLWVLGGRFLVPEMQNAAIALIFSVGRINVSNVLIMYY